MIYRHSVTMSEKVGYISGRHHEIMNLAKRHRSQTQLDSFSDILTERDFFL